MSKQERALALLHDIIDRMGEADGTVVERWEIEALLRLIEGARVTDEQSNNRLVTALG